MTRIVALMTMAVALLPRAARGEDAVAHETASDVVLKALVDELDRNREGLKIEGLQRPYFIEYALQDSAGFAVTARLGAVTDRGEQRARLLRTDVRVGTYELDNTNFAGDFGAMFGGMGNTQLPVEDDYNAIRQAVWWATDRDYKQVTESFEKKKAFMAQKMIEDKPTDFSKEEPVTLFEARVEPKVDTASLEKMALELSALFREYPAVKNSTVTLVGTGGNKYLVNSEGTRIRQAGTRYSVTIHASVQADDGMEMSDSIEVNVQDRADLPSQDELAAQTRDMVDHLLKLRVAPKLESYTGPVLFGAEAATDLFAGVFGGRFMGGQRPVGGRAAPDDFEKRLGERILPKTFDVVDDPTMEKLEGQRVLGHYKYDDQGVAAQKVVLVEAGKLKGLLMSRNPSKKFAKSNGHGRGPFRPMASTGCMVVNVKDGKPDDELKKTLASKAEDADKEYGIRIGSLGEDGGGAATPARAGGGGRRRRRQMMAMFGGMGGGGETPLMMFKVFPDGREELVRGAQLGDVDLKAFKRIVAAGKTQHVQNSGSPGTTIAAPAMLFEELDLTKIDRDFDKPPILPPPLARDAKPAAAPAPKQ